MSAVDQGYAAWLKADGLSTTLSPAQAARWTAIGRSVSVASPFATAVGAEAEGARVSALLGGPTVRDKVVVPGERRDLWGRTIRVRADRLDYAPAGEIALVIGFAEQDNGTTVLTVIRRLA